ncbi:MAG TPA: iduronate-2-sulfatase [Opitutae bacterium]|nr:iduronate-2-sulfatase [Opitutae bacterium]|tara:strand:- start:891 stop:2273 length:1383 start_codon:yes stop_codon:yes gene_type:complete
MKKPTALILSLWALSPTGAKPNILFIAVDDLRPELGCYGGKQVQSPHIDKLAARGTTFHRAYCQVAVCGASRASLMTGLRPTWKRFLKYDTFAEKDAPDAMTLPGELRKNGYHCLSNGKIFHHKNDTATRSWSEDPWKPDMGGASFIDPKSKSMIGGRKKRGPVLEGPQVPDNAYPDGQIADKTIADLKRMKKQGKPFFIACGFIKPHLPFYAPKKYWDLYDPADLELADNRTLPRHAPSSLKGSGEVHNYHDRGMKYNSDEWHRACLHGYYACVSYVDAQVGRLMKTLDQLKLSKDTIVILWGDHGWHLGEHNFWGKHNVMHLSTRSPLIVSAPGFKPGQTCDRLVEFVDVYPTLMELAGLKTANDGLQGTSFKPLLEKPGLAWKKAAFSKYGPAVSLVTNRYNYAEFKNGEKMLFDLNSDPDENVNLSTSPKQKENLKRLGRILKDGWRGVLPPTAKR